MSEHHVIRELLQKIDMNETSFVGGFNGKMDILNASSQAPFPPSTTTQIPPSTNLIFTINSKLLQYFYILLVCSISLLFLVRFYMVSRRGYAKLSTMLRVHLYAWMCCMINNVTYVVPVIYYWTRVDEEYSMLWMAFRGSTNNAGMIVAPLSTLLVTLDRIYTITLPLQHKKPLRFRLQMTCAFLLLMAFFVVTFIGFSRTYNPEKRTTTCLTYGCLLLGTQINDLVTFKIVISYINIVFGLAFVMLYFQSGRKLLGRREQKKNYITILILGNEFLFNVIPCTIYLLSFDKTVSSLKINFTSILMPAYCTDGFLTSIIFYRTWSEKLLRQANNARVKNQVQTAWNQRQSSSVVATTLRRTE